LGLIQGLYDGFKNQYEFYLHYFGNLPIYSSSTYDFKNKKLLVSNIGHPKLKWFVYEYLNKPFKFSELLILLYIIDFDIKPELEEIPDYTLSDDEELGDFFLGAN